MVEKQRLFVDMDGTLAEFKHVDTLETLYEQGYFLSLKPNENVVEAVRNIIHNHPEIEVNILSAVLSDSPYALNEKNAWLDKYLPEIDRDRRLFPFCGMDKKEFLLGGIRENDFLLDDYTHNLTLWCPPGRGIKVLNGINHTRGTWEGDKIRFDKNYMELSEDILHVMKGLTSIHDNRPGLRFDTQTYNDLDAALASMEKELKSMNGFETKYLHIGDSMSFKVFCYPDIDMHGNDICKYDVLNLSSQELFSKLEDFQVYSFFQDCITESFFLINEKDSLEPDFRYELEAQAKERAALLDITPPIYSIYQLKSGEENHNIRWLGYEDLTKQGNYPDINNYKLVYKGILEDGMTLEDIYQRFNLNQPEDFLGHIFSISDIVVLEKSGSYTAHYCDIYGFFECPNFAKQHEDKLSDNSTENEWEYEI